VPTPMAPRASDPDAIQAGVAATRTRLLGGRGTGASQAEIDRRTRGRSQLAGEPMPQHLAKLAGQTALARGDAAALALDIATARGELADGLQAIRGRFSPSKAAGWKRRVNRRASAAGAAAALVVVVLLRRRSRGRRIRQGLQ